MEGRLLFLPMVCHFSRLGKPKVGQKSKLPRRLAQTIHAVVGVERLVAKVDKLLLLVVLYIKDRGIGKYVGQGWPKGGQSTLWWGL